MHSAMTPAQPIHRQLVRTCMVSIQLKYRQLVLTQLVPTQVVPIQTVLKQLVHSWRSGHVGQQSSCRTSAVRCCFFAQASAIIAANGGRLDPLLLLNARLLWRLFLFA